ncbi:hypothetical protein OGH69_09885 [Flavobacterium sp. MFBS3-15]|uniref:hypothetical protein n=1 Tax=Flavobacterium sp. MFBS3-15 TaxID=2989816 RepID=UPI002235FD97|nr:hypothetical protein [Flavobacterium sp. MFBS3-15]MCW4469276.1 hypothetical protein [Flavobacterium sp. MFBS3-15]
MKIRNILFAVAILCLFAVLADLFLWFAVTGRTDSFEEARSLYVSYYPAALQNARLLTVMSILLLTIAGFIFLNAAKTNSLKKTAAILGIASAVLLMWKLFSLM